jgi:hypothetical protein
MMSRLVTLDGDLTKRCMPATGMAHAPKLWFACTLFGRSAHSCVTTTHVLAMTGS